MCLIAVGWQMHPHWPLVLLANRDEWRARPTAPLQSWDDPPDGVGGRDLQAGGSWLLLSARRRLAAVTNIRRMDVPAGLRSRGELVRDFIAADSTAAGWAERLGARATEYAPFNLLLWDGVALVLASMDAQFSSTSLAPGYYGISNGPADPPWSKALRPLGPLRRLLQQLEVRSPDDATREQAWSIMRDTAPLSDAELPQTGLDLARERWLSSAFIEGQTYGTRSSALVLAAIDRWWFGERRFDADSAIEGESAMQGRWRGVR